jgi:hypothetical protein
MARRGYSQEKIIYVLKQAEARDKDRRDLSGARDQRNRLFTIGSASTAGWASVSCGACGSWKKRIASLSNWWPT